MPEIGDPTHKIHGAIPGSDQGILAEQDRLSPHGGFGELGKHNPCHAGLIQGIHLLSTYNMVT